MKAEKTDLKGLLKVHEFLEAHPDIARGIRKVIKQGKIKEFCAAIDREIKARDALNHGKERPCGEK